MDAILQGPLLKVRLDLGNVLVPFLAHPTYCLFSLGLNLLESKVAALLPFFSVQLFHKQQLQVPDLRHQRLVLQHILPSCLESLRVLGLTYRLGTATLVLGRHCIQLSRTLSKQEMYHRPPDLPLSRPDISQN